MRAAPFRKLEHRAGNGDRIEDIIRKPCTHRDVPASPVLGDILTEERTLEVLFDRDAEHLRDTDRDVDTARKIGIKFQRVEHHNEEDIRSLEILRHIDHGVDRRKDTIRDHEFFEVTPDDSLKTSFQHAALKCMRREKLLTEIAVAADRALYELRKEAYEQRVLEEVLLRFVAVTINVDNIADGLECVKGNTHRQRDGQKVDPFRRVKSREDAVDVVDRKIGVFNDRKDQKRERDADRHDPAALLFLLFLKTLSCFLTDFFRASLSALFK